MLPEEFHNAMESALERFQELLDADKDSICIDYINNKETDKVGKYGRNISFPTRNIFFPRRNIAIPTDHIDFRLYLKSEVDVNANMLYFMSIDLMADNIEEMMDELSTPYGSFYLNQIKIHCKPEEWAGAIYRVLQEEIVKRFKLGLGLECSLIDLLSAQVYEGEKCKAGLIFVDDKDMPCVLAVPIKMAAPVYFSRDNIRQIRKLLAGAGNGYLLFQRDDNGYLCKGYCYRNLNGNLWWVVRFTGMGKWEFYHRKTPLFCIQDGEPKVFRDQVSAALKELETEFSWSEKITARRIRKKARVLLNIAMEQDHGTAVIFLDMTEENVNKHVSRLFNFQRAVDIQNLKRSEAYAVKALSRMDGAILVDAYTIKPMYAATIVDGLALTTGDLARGARHNSVMTFIGNIVNEYDECECGKKAAAAIFSEDGGVVTVRGQEIKQKIVGKK